jgi:putative SOS response-associated peptidase YedK
MCGRYALAAKPVDVEEEFSMIRIEWFPPRYNIAPTQPILVVRSEYGERRPALVRWGLVPSWAKDMASLPLFFNARAETAASKPAFRGPFRHRRCLIPATGFYEWRKDSGGRKQAFYLRPTGAPLIAFAGLWDEWTDDKGNILDSATILTTNANEDVAPIHERMPVVVEPEDYDRWLGIGIDAGDRLDEILRPSPAGSFEASPIDARVGNARIDDPSLQTSAKADLEPDRVAKKAEVSAAKSPPPPEQLKLL